jgi:hypothetical protein
MFGAQRNARTGEWRRLHNKELHALYFSPNKRWFKYDWDYLCVNKSQFVPVIFEPPCIIRVIKSGRMRWAGRVALTGERRGAYRALVGKPEGRRSLGRPRRRREDNIKMDFQEMERG